MFELTWQVVVLQQGPVFHRRKAIEGYAKAAGVVIVDWFYDAAVSGADPIEARPGFAALLAHIAGNGVRTIIATPSARHGFWRV